ncbi:germ cell-specific gene 1-like protein isoform X1 [Clarias gariepinus]|uniref:germ cell-specific gene 1-like protein isoform X1 n=1 Tax=Clarias gariepinus TaxID=13013 RepID=UPI00234D9F62|nr:germ cell-specific gene 1-like protein isoform X1 [Clarias gariepinus]
MSEHVPRRLRSLICLSLTSLALALSVLAFCTSYWCEGTQKVVKPLCLSAVKMEKCGQNNSQDFAVGTVQPESPSNGTVSPNQSEAFLKTQETQLANAVQYIWETGEDKYMLRYFHAGFWESCEKNTDGERCRRFLDLTPDDTHGVLWLSTISEFIHIGLLAMGFLLMWLEVLYSHKKMRALKINAFAALCTVLSGLIGMEAHMMYTTVFQLTVIVGPKDWRPQNWDYGWSFAMAWVSFSCCMGAAVLTFNSYTKTIIEIRHRQRLRQEDTHAAPSYEEVVSGGGIYSISGLQEHPDGMMDSMWLEHETIAEKAEEDIPTLLLIRGCEPEECEDCEREMDEV